MECLITLRAVFCRISTFYVGSNPAINYRSSFYPPLGLVYFVFIDRYDSSRSGGKLAILRNCSKSQNPDARTSNPIYSVSPSVFGNAEFGNIKTLDAPTFKLLYGVLPLVFKCVAFGNIVS
jgi:hypothetical protein